MVPRGPPRAYGRGYRGAQILTLDELFDHFGHTTRYYIETKSPDLNPGLEEALVERLEAYDMIDKAVCWCSRSTKRACSKCVRRTPMCPHSTALVLPKRAG